MQSVFPQRALLTVETAMTNKQSGVTLIELVVTIVVLSIALVGLSFAISGGLRQTSNTLFEVRAIALAQSYLDEILSKKSVSYPHLTLPTSHTVSISRH